MKTQLDPTFPLEPPELEAAAQRMRRNRACSEGKECLACARELQEARAVIVSAYNLGLSAGHAQWPELAANAAIFDEAAG